MPLLRVMACFDGKTRRFVRGRKDVFKQLKKWRLTSKKVIWVHAASFGEYQLVVPILEVIKNNDYDCSVLLTFFSPSGYEACKDNIYTSYVCYLPLDTPRAADKFLDVVNPQKVLIAKNEFWPNYLHNVGRRGIDCFLISGRFRNGQALMRPWAWFIRKSLKNFTRIFVIDEASKTIADRLGLSDSVLVTGDTGFDRVIDRAKENINIDFVKCFIGDGLCIVAGSTYPKDDKMFLKHMEHMPKNVKYIIVPHDIDKDYICRLQNQCPVKTLSFSDIDKDTVLSDCRVLILDTVGLLSKLYKYATITYIGGGFRKGGLHNVLEPAVFGCPIVIGPKYDTFVEAVNLMKLGGITSVTNTKTYIQRLNSMLYDPAKIRRMGAINKSYIESHKGATDRVIKNIGLNTL